MCETCGGSGRFRGRVEHIHYVSIPRMRTEFITSDFKTAVCSTSGEHTTTLPTKTDHSFQETSARCGPKTVNVMEMHVADSNRRACSRGTIKVNRIFVSIGAFSREPQIA